MHFAYSVLTALAFLAFTPHFLLHRFRHGKARRDFLGRWGGAPCLEPSSSRIWVHAVSVGEVLAVAPLLEALRWVWPGLSIVLTTVTVTGQQIARQKFPDAEAIFYFPLDWAWAVRRALDRVRPCGFLTVDTEIWPNFLRECRRRGIGAALVNGRISDRSFPRYRWVRFFLSRVLNDLGLMCMQSKLDAERILELGAVPERVHVTGNLKYDAFNEPRSKPELDAFLDRALDQAPVLVAGSTVAGEEQLLVQAFLQLKETSPGLRLLLAPRRPERFEAVATLLRLAGLSFVRRSARNGSPADVILLDTLGELFQVYGRATLCFIGGSLVPAGGHNPAEPAFHAKAILFGPHMENFRQMAGELLRESAAVQVRDSSELVRSFQKILSDQPLRERLGQNARRVLDNNRGAAARTAELLLRALGPDPSVKVRSASGPQRPLQDGSGLGRPC